MDRDEDQQYELKLEHQLSVIERKLLELKSRWPAHSLQPAMMIELENLEEERERLQFLLNPRQVFESC